MFCSVGFGQDFLTFSQSALVPRTIAISLEALQQVIVNRWERASIIVIIMAAVAIVVADVDRCDNPIGTTTTAMMEMAGV